MVAEWLHQQEMLCNARGLRKWGNEEKRSTKDSNSHTNDFSHFWFFLFKCEWNERRREWDMVPQGRQETAVFIGGLAVLFEASWWFKYCGKIRREREGKKKNKEKRKFGRGIESAVNVLMSLWMQASEAFFLNLLNTGNRLLLNSLFFFFFLGTSFLGLYYGTFCKNPFLTNLFCVWHLKFHGK